MGLDVNIVTQSEKGESCYELSRVFCRLICDLADSTEGTPILVQLFNIYESDISLIQKMNVWELEKHFWDTEHDLTNEVIEKYYERIWQDAKQVLSIIKSLYRKIENNPVLLKSIQTNNCRYDIYFDNFLLDKGKYLVDRNFGWDLRTIIKYLDKLKEGEKIRFYFL